MIEFCDPMAFPLCGTLLYAVGILFGSACSQCCDCQRCTGRECCGSEWPLVNGTCCDGQWYAEAGQCCGDDWHAAGDSGQCCDHEWHTGSGTCCKAKTLPLLIVGCGDGAAGTLKWLSSGLSTKLVSGGSGYVVSGPVRTAPTLTVSGGSGSGLQVSVTLGTVSDECGRTGWRIASVAFTGGTGYRYVAGTPGTPGSGTPPGGGTSNLGGGTSPNPSGEPYVPPIPATPVQDKELLTVSAAEGDTTLLRASLAVTSNSSGVPIAVTIVNGGLYHRDTGETRVYASAPTVSVVLGTPLGSGLGGGSPGTLDLGGAAFAATVDADPESATFGQVTGITITNAGNKYTEWAWDLKDHWFTGQGGCCDDVWYAGEGTCCGNEWETDEGTCCNEVWYPDEEPCPEGQVFINNSATCCGCMADEVYDPEEQEMVPTLDNLTLVECPGCNLEDFPYARFDEFGTDRGPIGRCCGPGGSCEYTFEQDCAETWEEKCCPDEPQCEVACCREDDDGASSCEVVPKNECESPDVQSTQAACENSCRGACCVDGVLTESPLSQEECDDAGGCWGGVGSDECYSSGDCRPPLTRTCCESVISGESGLTFTQPRSKRCDNPNEPVFVTVTGTTDSPVLVHGVPFGIDATPSKRCPIRVSFTVCWDEFNIEPLPCNTSFSRLEVTVCWGTSEESLESLAYSGCDDITLWLGDCTRDCETTLTYDGPGVEVEGPVQLRGDATIEANGGALVFPEFVYAASCNITLTLDGTSTAANAVGAMANPGQSSTLALKKKGSGRWRLTAASTFTGATEVIGGTLVVATNAPIDGNGAFGYSLNGGLGGGSSPIVTLAGGAALLLDAGAQVGRIIDITGGNGLATVGGANGSGTTRFQSVMTFFVSQDVRLQAASGGVVEFANGWLGGSYGNASSVTNGFSVGSAGNTGTVLVSGNLSTEGAVEILYGIMEITGSVVASGVTVNGTNAELKYNGTVPLESPLYLVQGTLSGDAEILTAALSNLTTIRVDDQKQIEITEAMSGYGSVTKAGAGTLRVSADNTFSGTLAVTAGTLAGNAVFGIVSIANSPTILVDSGDEIEISELLIGSVTNTLLKNGAGTLRISNRNEFVGTLNIAAGTVAVEYQSGLATSATFTNTTLSVAFSGDPATGAQYRLLAGGTTQTYTPTLTGTNKTGTYYANSSIVVIN